MTLPSNFWSSERLYLMAIIKPRLQALAFAGIRDAEGKLEGMGITFDNALAHVQAAQWARQHTDELLNMLGTTNQQVTGAIIDNWITTPGATIGDLVAQLKPVLDENAVRSWRVAVTETTRAFAEGNAIAYAQAGVKPVMYKPPAHVNCRCDIAVKRLPEPNIWVAFWTTNRDELVCKRPIQTNTILGVVNGCSALNGIIVSEGEWFGKKI